jgi:hypothetical protein
MKRSAFLLISALGSFGFGALMFFGPSVASLGLGITASPETGSVLRGMGGLIMGLGTMNLLARQARDEYTFRMVFLTNIITHTLGLLADLWGVSDGVLKIAKMAPVELTHLFIGLGSLYYWLKIRSIKTVNP